MGRVVARVGAVCAAVAVVVAGLVGCGAGKDRVAGVPTATVPTVPPDPYAVPAVIDEAYVNRVLAGLDQADGDVLRMVVSTKTVPPEALDRLKTLYLDSKLLQLRLNILQDSLYSRFDGLKIPPGDRKTAVTKIISATPECIFAEVEIDASEVALAPDSALGKQWISVVPVPTEIRRLDYNRTSWAFTYRGFQRDLSAPADPCVH